MRRRTVATGTVLLGACAFAVHLELRSPRAAAASGGLIAFARGGTLVVANADGSAMRVLVRPRRRGELISGPLSWPRDGKILFARSSRDGSPDALETIKPDGSDDRTIGPGLFARAAPDGSLIAYSVVVPDTAGGSPQVELWLEGADGSNSRRLTIGATDLAPSWSPDSRVIAFTRNLGDFAHPRASLWTIRASGEDLHQLTAGPEDQLPAWSPDGSQIAFVSGRNHNGEICGDDRCAPNPELYVMRADGSDQRRLTHTRAVESFPAWRPDGKRIAFSSTRASPALVESYAANSEIYSAKPDGSCVRRITRDAARTDTPAYSPDATGPECPPATSAPVQPGFDYGSTVWPSDLHAVADRPIYWLGTETSAFSLTSIQRNPAGPPGQKRGTSTMMIYACAVTATGCKYGVQLQLWPLDSRPILADRGSPCLSTQRGVPVVHYGDRVDLFTGRTIITIFGAKREIGQAIRRISSANARAGTIRPGRPLRPPPPNTVQARAC